MWRMMAVIGSSVWILGATPAETDAVVVGYKDFSEPTPIDIINAMDYVCLNGQYLVAGSAEALAAGASEWGLGNGALWLLQS